MAHIKFEVFAVSVNIWFNKYGDHDHDGMMYILKKYKGILEYVKRVQKHYKDNETAETLSPELIKSRNDLITEFGLAGDFNRINEWLPDTKAGVKIPHPLIVPLVLRAAKGDTVEIKLINEIVGRKVGIHLIGPGTTIASDGTDIWDNPSS